MTLEEGHSACLEWSVPHRVWEDRTSRTLTTCHRGQERYLDVLVGRGEGPSLYENGCTEVHGGRSR